MPFDYPSATLTQAWDVNAQGDVAGRKGAPNVDSRCTGTTMRDYLRGTDLSRLPEDMVKLYDDGTEIAAEILVFPPTAAKPFL